MTYVFLYRKYRPKTFKDVVGQKIVVKILKNSIKENKIAHAYIFAGPRGVGKTSIAKIFSKAVNCLNPNIGDLCEKCEVCLNNMNNEIDIIEIDAASNNGVDEIREIRNSINLMPSKLKYKVYIIDEVHMLSLSAFNALLKTLEEPPAHAIFILATTEVNKIPSTVISRCQKFDFEKISTDSIEKQLNKILKLENRTVNDKVIKLIAKISDGGMRDAINLLDQILSLNKNDITTDDIFKIIGEITDEELLEVVNNIFNSDMSNLLKKLEKFCNKGINFDSVCNKLQVFIRDILIYKNTKNYFDSEYESRLDKYCNFKDDIYIKLCQELFSLSNELKKTSSQKMLVEIYFIKMVLLLSNNDNTTNINNNNNAILNDNSTQLKVADEQNYIKKIRINNALSGANKEFKNKFIDKFKIIDEYTSSKKYNSLASILKKANVEVVSDKNIIFSFKNSFETVLFDKNNLEIDEFISKIFNREYKTTSVTLEEWNEIKNNYIKNVNNGIKYEYIDEQKQKNKKNNNSELDNTLSNIFGEKYKIID